MKQVRVKIEFDIYIDRYVHEFTKKELDGYELPEDWLEIVLGFVKNIDVFPNNYHPFWDASNSTPKILEYKVIEKKGGRKNGSNRKGQV